MSMKFLRRKKVFDEHDIQVFVSTLSSQSGEYIPAINEALACITAGKKLIEKDLVMAQKKHDTALYKLLRKDKRKGSPYSEEDVAFYQRLLTVMLEGREDLEEKLNQMVIQAQEIRQLFNKQRDEIIAHYADAFEEKKLPLPIDSPKLSFQFPNPIPNLKKKESDFPFKYEIAAYDREKREAIRFIIANLLGDLSYKANHSFYPKDNYQQMKKFVKRHIRKANASPVSYPKVFCHSMQTICALSISQNNLIKAHFQAKYRQAMDMIAQSPYAINQ